jgi:hypothetical protein
MDDNIDAVERLAQGRLVQDISMTNVNSPFGQIDDVLRRVEGIRPDGAPLLS